MFCYISHQKTSQQWFHTTRLKFGPENVIGSREERIESCFLEVMVSLLCLCLCLSFAWGAGGGAKPVTFLGPPTQTVSILTSQKTSQEVSILTDKKEKTNANGDDDILVRRSKTVISADFEIRRFLFQWPIYGRK